MNYRKSERIFRQNVRGPRCLSLSSLTDGANSENSPCSPTDVNIWVLDTNTSNYLVQAVVPEVHHS